MKKISKMMLMTSTALLLAACADTTEENQDAAVEDEPTEQVEETEDTEITEETETTDDSEETDDSETADDTESEEADAESVTVDMLNNDGESAGTAVFEETDEGVTLELSLEGLPEGEYGMHIHEVGQATPPTFEDAGSHFNPTDVEHGTESETGPHIGDLPNLEVPEDGIVEETIEIPDTTLAEDGENSLNWEQGTSLIVHTEADDYETQPTGDAGDRMLGGVIFEGSETE